LKARNRNELWGTVLIDELARAGVRHLVVSPGSRSAPVVLAAAADPRLRIHVQIDERSAAFVALGAGKGTGSPAAVLTTSGTAVANLLPAVVEAAHAETPLLLLTADRPPRLRGADANQTIDQVRIFGGNVRLFEDLDAGEVDEAALRHLRSVVSRAVAAALGDPAGPVHLNLGFDKPLEPTPIPGDLVDELAERRTPASRGRGNGAAWTRVLPRRARGTEALVEGVADALDRARRPLVVAGVLPRPWEAGPALRTLAAAWGIPLLADPLSGARFPESTSDAGAPVFGGYDIALRDPGTRDRLRPDYLLRVGASPTSSVLTDWLSGLADLPHVVVDGGGRWKDHSGVATETLPCDAAAFATSLALRAPAATAESDWLERWSAVDASVRAGLAEVVRTDHRTEGPLFEGQLVAEVARLVPSEDLLFVSSSMPVRDLDAFVPRRAAPLPTLGNRGASGIDGIVSTAAGISLATERRVVAILGDLALLHDSNGLASLRDPGVRVALVVINNDGGGIFHFLPVREFEPAFTPLFATPHGRDFSRLAAFHGIPHVCVDAREPGTFSQVHAGVEGVLETRGSAILEIRTDREVNRRRRAEVVQRIAAAAAGASTERKR
jgi:2-succinyl-5-enolpyruvyl-6-hydroxy-3-cyclohexene-1-carboxylate synthase